jgi:hypothetical protein
MAPKCPVCEGSFRDSDRVVQLESADIIHSSCWGRELDEMLESEVAKRCSYSEIHEDWKR